MKQIIISAIAFIVEITMNAQEIDTSGWKAGDNIALLFELGRLRWDILWFYY